ncbi:MAG TPA: secretin N-terminal domain-containing protein [Pyrinomonadaceae bacterium]
MRREKADFRGRTATTPAEGRLRSFISGAFRALFVLSLLWAWQATVAAQKGQKSYKQGLQHEQAQQWERAAEEFALAVAAEPANVEYQLHFRRAVFNASQAFTQQGHVLAEKGDYVGAYNAFRRAYNYDPANELALSLMERMLKLQLGKDGKSDAENLNDGTASVSKLTASSLDAGSLKVRVAGTSVKTPMPLSPRAEQLRAINFSGDLEDFIRHIAREVDLNVIFDREFPPRAIKIDLRDVTAAQALDHIFFSQGLFFQKLSRRTILVADQSKRPQYQQLVLRTFYLSNTDPADAQKLIQSVIPPQVGRQAVIAVNKTTNSLTVRDTPENIRLVSDLIRSIDKERAEVVMDVNIYEVSRNDLLQLGNQIGSESTLKNLGGIQKGFSILGGSREVVTQGLNAVTAPTALGAALLVPASALSALQRKDQTRLIASTQLHAFDGEKSTAHIGQRVPVQTAAVTPLGTTVDDKNTQGAVNAGVFGGNGFPIIQYEKTGLTLEFTPQVFQNLDVQVKMSIKSNDVTNQGVASLTPTFTERNIEGTARIQNNRTMMIASVAQNQQSRGRQGLPVLGLVPVFGRLFTAPRRNDQQTDIVIAVTPHVMRAPALTPQDEELRPTGTLQTPNSDSLEALLQEIERDDQLATARRLPTNAVIHVSDAGEPASQISNTEEFAYAYVPAPNILTGQTDSAIKHDAVKHDAERQRYALAASDTSQSTSDALYQNRQKSPFTGDILKSPASPRAERAEKEEAAEGASVDVAASTTEETNASLNKERRPTRVAQLRLVSGQPQMRVGERQQLRLLLKTDAALSLVTATLRFDPKVVAVRSVSQGSIFAGGQSAPTISQAVNNQSGAALISAMPPRDGSHISAAGTLLHIEIEALASGETSLNFDADDVILISADNSKVILKQSPVRVTVSK